MKPAPFDYRAPESTEEALELLGKFGDDAKVLAGGQSLIPLLALRLARPALLIDLRRVPGLDRVGLSDGHLAIGSMVRERMVERSELARSRAPLLSEALPLIGHPAIRSRGTVGGSLAHADPAAELPSVALALDATMVVVSAQRARREIPAAEFFRGYFSTAVEPDELLMEVRFPELPAGSGTSFQEVSRRHGDFAMVGVAAAVTLRGGLVTEARLALTGVADTPVRPAAERELVGSAPTPELLTAVAAAVQAELRPGSDLHGSSQYRRQVAGVLVRRVLGQAVLRAGGAGTGDPDPGKEVAHR